MDKLDVKIIREILGGTASPSFSDPGLRRSFRGIARNLHVDEGTIRNRMKKLQRSGVFRRWTIGINPRLFGQEMAQLWFDVGSEGEKELLLRKISLLVRGVATIENYLGTSLSIRLCYESALELNRDIQLIAELTNCKNIIQGAKQHLRCDLDFTRLDWAIIKSLQENPWKEYRLISKEVGASVARVKRRMDRMNETGALYILADVNPKLQEGTLMVGLAVFFEDGKRKDQVNQTIIEHLGDQLAFDDTDDGLHSYFGVVLTNVLKMQEISGWVRALSGVREVRAAVLQDSISLESVYDEYAERYFRSR